MNINLDSFKCLYIRPDMPIIGISTKIKYEGGLYFNIVKVGDNNFQYKLSNKTFDIYFDVKRKFDGKIPNPSDPEGCPEVDSYVPEKYQNKKMYVMYDSKTFVKETKYPYGTPYEVKYFLTPILENNKLIVNPEFPYQYLSEGLSFIFIKNQYNKYIMMVEHNGKMHYLVPYSLKENSGFFLNEEPFTIEDKQSAWFDISTNLPIEYNNIVIEPPQTSAPPQTTMAPPQTTAPAPQTTTRDNEEQNNEKPQTNWSQSTTVNTGTSSNTDTSKVTDSNKTVSTNSETTIRPPETEQTTPWWYYVLGVVLGLGFLVAIGLVIWVNWPKRKSIKNQAD